jgi:hypothetical protein
MSVDFLCVSDGKSDVNIGKGHNSAYRLTNNVIPRWHVRESPALQAP